MRAIPEIRGHVRSESGDPVAGALVMGADLAWVETAADGSFTLRRPEMAIFCWCAGFYPGAQVLRPGAPSVAMTLRPLPAQP